MSWPPIEYDGGLHRQDDDRPWCWAEGWMSVAAMAIDLDATVEEIADALATEVLTESMADSQVGVDGQRTYSPRVRESVAKNLYAMACKASAGRYSSLAMSKRSDGC